MRETKAIMPARNNANRQSVKARHTNRYPCEPTSDDLCTNCTEYTEKEFIPGTTTGEFVDKYCVATCTTQTRCRRRHMEGTLYCKQHYYDVNVDYMARFVDTVIRPDKPVSTSKSSTIYDSDYDAFTGFLHRYGGFPDDEKRRFLTALKRKFTLDSSIDTLDVRASPATTRYYCVLASSSYLKNIIHAINSSSSEFCDGRFTPEMLINVVHQANDGRVDDECHQLCIYAMLHDVVTSKSEFTTKLLHSIWSIVTVKPSRTMESKNSTLPTRTTFIPAVVPSGLPNVGNTCHINAAVQLLVPMFVRVMPTRQGPQGDVFTIVRHAWDENGDHTDLSELIKRTSLYTSSETNDPYGTIVDLLTVLKTLENPDPTSTIVPRCWDGEFYVSDFAQHPHILYNCLLQQRSSGSRGEFVLLQNNDTMPFTRTPVVKYPVDSTDEHALMTLHLVSYVIHRNGHFVAFRKSQFRPDAWSQFNDFDVSPQEPSPDSGVHCYMAMYELKKLMINVIGTHISCDSLTH